MAAIRIDGRARLVGVSCKCEIGKVTARGAGIAKIPGVTAFTAIGNIRGRGDGVALIEGVSAATSIGVEQTVARLAAGAAMPYKDCKEKLSG
jgi:hypothetical protein